MLNSNAYKLFLKELATYAAPDRYSLSLVKPPTKEQWQDLAIGFHTVKGGAGFFGLNEIVETAAAIEKIALRAEQTLSALSELQGHLDQFRNIAKQVLNRGNGDV